jgi:hypothetical protein
MLMPCQVERWLIAYTGWLGQEVTLEYSRPYLSLTVENEKSYDYSQNVSPEVPDIQDEKPTWESVGELTNLFRNSRVLRILLFNHSGNGCQCPSVTSSVERCDTYTSIPI